MASEFVWSLFRDFSTEILHKSNKLFNSICKKYKTPTTFIFYFRLKQSQQSLTSFVVFLFLNVFTISHFFIDLILIKSSGWHRFSCIKDNKNCSKIFWSKKNLKGKSSLYPQLFILWCKYYQNIAWIFIWIIIKFWHWRVFIWVLRHFISSICLLKIKCKEWKKISWFFFFWTMLIIFVPFLNETRQKDQNFKAQKTKYKVEKCLTIF